MPLYLKNICMFCGIGLLIGLLLDTSCICFHVILPERGFSGLQWREKRNTERRLNREIKKNWKLFSVVNH